jgi:uncharacterized protein (DUF111 family)
VAQKARIEYFHQTGSWQTITAILGEKAILSKLESNMKINAATGVKSYRI